MESIYHQSLYESPFYEKKVWSGPKKLKKREQIVKQVLWDYRLLDMSVERLHIA